MTRQAAHEDRYLVPMLPGRKRVPMTAILSFAEAFESTLNLFANPD